MSSTASASPRSIARTKPAGPRRAWSRLATDRVVLYSINLALALLGQNGQQLFIISTITVVLALALHLRHRQPFFGAVAAWELGFLFIVCLEGIADYGRIARTVGPDNALTAARYLTAGNAIAMLAHAAVFRRRLLTESWSSGRRVKARRVAIFIGVLFALYVLGTFAGAVQMYQEGRVGGPRMPWADSASGAVLSGLIKSGGLILPTMIAFYVLWVRGGRFRTALLLAAPVILIQFVLGTRFHLLFGLGGLVLVRLTSGRLSRRGLATMVVVGLGLFAASTVMTSFRTFGLGNTSVTQLQSHIEDRGLLQHEGVVRGVAELVDYFDRFDHLGGSSSASVTVFFIPRALWPDKPVLLGYWFPRRYGHQGFSSGYSASYTFAGDAYADFGFAGGIAFVFALGLLIGGIDRWASSVIAKRGHPTIVIVAPLYASFFFMVRSPATTLIVSSGVVLLGLVFIRLLRARARAATRQAPAPQTVGGRPAFPSAQGTPRSFRTTDG